MRDDVLIQAIDNTEDVLLHVLNGLKKLNNVYDKLVVLDAVCLKCLVICTKKVTIKQRKLTMRLLVKT